MKKKTKIARSVNDIIFSEIDLKETTFNNKDVVYYSLDIMSDNSSNNSPVNSDNGSNNSGSFNLDDYDLDIDNLSEDLNDNLNIKNISIKNSSNLSLSDISQEEDNLNIEKNKNNDIDEGIDDIDNEKPVTNYPQDEIIIDNIRYTKCEDTKTKLNTSEFFNILNQKKTNKLNNKEKKDKEGENDNENGRVELNDNEEEENIEGKNTNEVNDNEVNDEVNDNEVNDEVNDDEVNDEVNDDEVNDEVNDDEVNDDEVNDDEVNGEKKSIEDLHNMNTLEKNNIWKDLIDTNINAQSSYNYLQTESQNNTLVSLINKDRLFKFYKLAEKNKKNIYGYVDNNKIHNCDPQTTYEYEVHTKLTNENIDPPGNYINIFMKKDLDKIKCVYLLNSNGYWTMEPLENFNTFKENETKQKILLIYFIILKILFCNKHYPFNDGNSIQKYRNLTKNINLNIINHINNNSNFKNYINSQFKNVFKLNDTIEGIIQIINDNNINKYYGRILKLKYKYY